jgi:ABC-type antimicrobial peptide transport system ATPase subunit
MPSGCRFAPRGPHDFDRCVNEPPLYPAPGGRASCFLLDPAERRA